MPANASAALVAEMGTAMFWILRLWLVLLLLNYCTMRELVRALGRERIRRVFLGTSNAA